MELCFKNKYLNRVHILTARPNCKLQSLARKETLHKKGTHNNTNEQDTSFLDCKHKHMMKNGAPPDKF